MQARIVPARIVPGGRTGGGCGPRVSVTAMSLQVEVPAGGDSGGGSDETPASTRLARELSAQLGGVLAQPPRSLGAASGAFSQGAAAAASANLQAIKFAQVSGYDYCGANVEEILAEKDGDDGKQLLLVSWLGRCVPNKWVPRTFLEDDYVSRGVCGHTFAAPTHFYVQYILIRHRDEQGYWQLLTKTDTSRQRSKPSAVPPLPSLSRRTGSTT